MEYLNYSTGSEEEQEEDQSETIVVNPAIARGIPQEIGLKFSKTPIHQSNHNQTPSHDQKQTSFVYLSTTPSESQIQAFRLQTCQLLSQLSQLMDTSKLQLDHHFWHDTLTQSTRELHVSLSTNQTLSPADLSRLVSHLQANSHRAGLPRHILFKGLSLLPNQDRSKLFVCLLLADQDVAELVADLSLSQGLTYDPKMLHCSIGQLLVKRSDRLTAADVAAASTVHASFESYLLCHGVFVTTGRTVLRI